MRWLPGVLLVTCVTAIGCDRRPEAPLLNHAGSTTARAPESAVTEPGPTPSLTVEEDEKKPDRCMVPVAKTPGPKPPPAGACPQDPIFGGLTLDKAKLSFPEAPEAPTIDVELALEPAQRQRGLMYRTHMDENAGMLFHFPGPERVQSFWMRNTCIPLDMLFITSDGFIAGIQENVPTLNDASRSVPCPVRYVLEVNAGWTRAHGVKPGQKVKLPAID